MCLPQDTAAGALPRTCQDSQHSQQATRSKASLQLQPRVSNDQPAQLAALAVLGALCVVPECQALELHAEPANALSLPTWAIHTSSVAEWVTAMALIWRYAEVSNNPSFKSLT